MTYDKIIQFSFGRTCKCNLGIIRGNPLQRQSGGGIDGNIRSLQTASISVYSGSSKNKTQITGARTEGGIHRKTSGEPATTCKAAGEIHRGISKPYRHPSAGSIYQKKRACQRRLFQGKYRCSTALTAWLSARFPRCIRLCFPRRSILVGRAQPNRLNKKISIMKTATIFPGTLPAVEKEKQAIGRRPLMRILVWVLGIMVGWQIFFPMLPWHVYRKRLLHHNRL